jgi:hypothetical protein
MTSLRTTLRSAIWNCACAGLVLFARAGTAAIGTPVLEWQRCPPAYCHRGWYASPAALDVDRDGVVEVLWGGYALMSVNGDTGVLEWMYPNGGDPGRMWPGVAVADLEGDGDREIVVVQHQNITALDASGAPLLGWPVQPFGSSEMRTLAVADLDADGAFEILTARASGGSYDTWTVLDASGATRDGWPRLDPGEDPGYAWGAYNQNLAAGDLDGDGDLEIAASSDVHYLAAFADSGDQLGAASIYGANKGWSQVGVHYSHATDLVGYADCGADPPVSVRPNFADAPPAIGDLDGDGANEIVVVGSFYDCSALDYQQLFQVPMVFNADRTRWAPGGGFDWIAPPVPDGSAAPLSIDYDVIESAEANPALADLDGDGVQEILHASYDGRVHAYWASDRTEHGLWPFDVNLGETALRFASEPAVADLDGDDEAEVVFTTWTAKGSDQAGDLFIVSALGAELARIALPRSTQSWDGALGAPTIANLDGDPELEVVTGTAHTGLVAYEIPGSHAGRAPWPTGRGNVLRTAPEPGAGAAAFVATAAIALLARQQTSRHAALGAATSQVGVPE